MSWWKGPWWVIQLATGAKSFVDNPILGSVSLNKRGLHAARVRIAHSLAKIRRARLAVRIDPSHQADFERDGFLCLPDFLPAEHFDAFRNELLGSVHEVREHRQGDTITRRVAVGPHFIRLNPAIARVIESREWKNLMSYVASTDGEPLYYLQSIISGLDGPPDPQRQLHADSFQPALKAWLFSTDVADDQGPLTYVAGSHRLTPERLDWERRRSITVLDDGELLSQRGSLRIAETELAGLGLPPPTRFAAKANTLVIIDTFGFHARGVSAGQSVRAELWAYRRRTPFLPWTGLSITKWPAVALRRTLWVYRIIDWLDAKGWRKQHWKPAGRKRLTDR